MTATTTVLDGFPPLPPPSPRRLPGVSTRPLVVAVNARGVILNRHSRATQRAYYRAVDSGRMTYAAADQLANILLGEHPATIWGDDWWNGQS